VGAAQDAVADGVGEGGIAQVVVPMFRVELAGHDGGSGFLAVLEHLEKIASILIGDRRNREVVEDEHVDAGNASEHARVRAVGTRQSQLVEEARGAAVEHAVALSANLMRKRARDVALACARRAGDEDRLMFLHPAASGELSDEGLVELPPRGIVDCFDARLG